MVIGRQVEKPYSTLAEAMIVSAIREADCSFFCSEWGQFICDMAAPALHEKVARLQDMYAAVFNYHNGAVTRAHRRAIIQYAFPDLTATWQKGVW